MDLAITILLTILFLIILGVLFFEKKQVKKYKNPIILTLIALIIVIGCILIKKIYRIYFDSKSKKMQHFMSGGGTNKRNKLLDMCKLPKNNYETSHCFNDSTHHTCCMLGPKARKYADSSGNPIGTASEKAFKKKFGRAPNPNEKTGWCTCFGSEVCSQYAKKFNDGTHIKFVNDPSPNSNKVVKKVSPRCEGYWRDYFDVEAHGTPGVNTPTSNEYNSNFCKNRNKPVNIFN